MSQRRDPHRCPVCNTVPKIDDGGLPTGDGQWWHSLCNWQYLKDTYGWGG